MIFSTTEIEKEGSDAYINGLQRNINPYIGKEGFKNAINKRLWYYGYDQAKNDCRAI